MKSNLIHIMRVMFSIIWGILEIFRVQNGYEGNIRESVLLDYNHNII